MRFNHWMRVPVAHYVPRHTITSLPTHSPLHHSTQSSIRYPISTQEAGNVPVTFLELRVSMGSDDRQLSDRCTFTSHYVRKKGVVGGGRTTFDSPTEGLNFEAERASAKFSKFKNAVYVYIDVLWIDSLPDTEFVKVVPENVYSVHDPIIKRLSGS
ncbi:hypothetical protein EVAR_40378_1 [Eumeta japonica]|uniref:Uncharacterized protein n=1 Tax=Eumeta variegata TaxID=151549 RepID=A0A4C1XK31_EUMVA|nr:hypothetical protein EVAR_40378_1 [Eumeta japonica]